MKKLLESILKKYGGNSYKKIKFPVMKEEINDMINESKINMKGAEKVVLTRLQSCIQKCKTKEVLFTLVAEKMFELDGDISKDL